MYDIRFFNPELELKGEFAEYRTATCHALLREAGDFEIVCSSRPDGLALDDVVMMSGAHHFVGIVEQIEDETAQGVKTVTVRGVTLLGLLSRRIGVLGGALMTYTNKPIETIIKDMIARKYNDVGQLVILVNRARGATLARFQATTDALLDQWGSEITYQVAAPSGASDPWEGRSIANPFGLSIVADLAAREYVFDVVEPTDHSAASAAPVLFSVRYDNITDQYVVQSVAAAYGVGIYKKVTKSGDTETTTYPEVGSGSGWARREIYIDTEDKGEAESELAKLAPVLNLSGGVQESETFAYGADYRLGDYVTVVGDELQGKVQITGVTESVQSGHYTMGLDLGDSITEKIKTLKKHKEV